MTKSKKARKAKSSNVELKMETPAETEKTSYDIKPVEDESAGAKTETYEPISEDAALLPEKQPEQPEPEEPEEKPVEATDETTALTEKENVDPEDLTKKEPSSQSLKGRFLQLFDRKKPAAAADDEPAAPAVESQQNGDTPHTTPEQVAEPAQTTTKKRFLPPINFKNPFIKKSESSTPIAPADTENAENPDQPAVADGEQKDGAEASEVPPATENGEEKKGERKLAISNLFF